MKHKADGWWMFSTSKATPENPKYLGAKSHKKKRKKITMKKIVTNIFTCMLIIIFTWIAISFIDVIGHNLTDYNYASWNIFEIMIKNI